MASYDEVTEDAVSTFERFLDTPERGQVRTVLHKATIAAEAAWTSAVAGVTPGPESSPPTMTWSPIR
eukprot:3336838-Karenia_brevis.AAC.1